MKLKQKQQMSFVKKVVLIGGASLLIALIAFVGLKIASTEDSIADSQSTWTGNVNSDWNNKRNWSDNTLPSNGSTIKIEEAKNWPVIDRNSNFTINDLILDEEATLTANANLTISGDVYLGDETSFQINKGTIEIGGSAILTGEDCHLIQKGGKMEVSKNLILVSVDDADSTYLKLKGGQLVVNGATNFLRKESKKDAFILVKGGELKLNVIEKENSSYDNGRILILVEGGSVDFVDDLIMEDNDASSSFTFKESSPCNDATAWDKGTTYEREKTERIYVTHNSNTYRMKPGKYWSKANEPGEKGSDDIWEETKCEDYCDLAEKWEAKTEYKRSKGGDEIYVSYKGIVYEMAYDVWWSENHSPDNNSKYWTKIKQCEEYEAPTCGSVQQWNSATEYKRNSKEDIIEVFYDGDVYRMKTNKWWSKNDEPSKTGKIWQYNRECEGSSSTSSLGKDSLKHSGGIITFNKKWTRPPGFKSTNGGTIKFNNRGEKLKLQRNDEYENLEVEEGVELDVEGDVFVKGNLKVNGTCSGASIINLNGSSKQKISGGGTIANLTVNNKNDVELNDNLTINGALTLTEGDIELGDNDISLEGTTTHGNSNSYLKINGDGVVKVVVGSDPVIIPIGRNPYEPIVIDDGGGAEYSVGVHDLVFENPENSTNEITTESVSETWYVQSSAEKSNVSITLGFNADQELSGFDKSSCFVAYWETGVSNVWIPGSTGSTTGDGPYFKNIVLSTMSTNQYFFGIGSGNSALPVEFLYFKARALDQKVELTWATATETNNDYFAVQRSDDGVTWTTIEKIGGFGTTLEQQDYQTYDNSPKSGLNYYRLKQVDFDGATDYSGIKQVHFGGSTVGGLEIKSIYPNPFSDVLNIELKIPSASNVDIELVNSSGQTLKSRSEYLYDGVQVITLNDLTFLEKGAYIVVVSNQEFKISKTVLKR